MTKKYRRNNFIIEQLEQRLLFSADFEPVPLDSGFEENILVGSSVEEMPLLPAASEVRSIDRKADLRREILFIDRSIPDYELLAEDMLKRNNDGRQVEVVILDISRNGIIQISETLGKYQDLDAVHVVSHGSDGSIQLGNAMLTDESIDIYADSIEGWKYALNSEADLLFYGCDLGAGEEGRALLNNLTLLTGADVAGSVDTTGHTTLGGDWHLEYESGPIETAIAFSADAQAQWVGLMAIAVDNVSTGTTTGSTINISHTTSGTNRLMLVGVSFGKGISDTVDSITYNGANLTYVGSHGGGSDPRVEIWSLVAPDVGTNNLVVNFSGGSGTEGATAGVTTFTGVEQSTPLGTFASANGTSTQASTTVSSAANELVFGVVGVRGDDNFNLSPGSGQTEQWDVHTSGTNGGASTEEGAASVVTSWIWGDENRWAVGGVSIKPTIEIDPELTMPGPAINYTENDPVTIFDSTATVTDADSLDFDNGTLTVSFSAGGTANDVLEIIEGGTVTLVSSNVRVDGTTVGSFSGGTGGTDLVITWDRDCTPADAQAVLRQIAYRNTSEDPSTAARTIDFVLTDGDGGTSTTVQKTVNVAAENDAPFVLVNTGLSIIFGDTDLVSASMLNVYDYDNTTAEVTYTLTATPSNGTLQLSGTPLVVNDTFTQADISNELLNYVHGGANSNPDSFTFTAADGVGGTLGATVFNIQIVTDSGGNDPPVVTLPGPAVSYTEGDPVTLIDPLATVMDVDSKNMRDGWLRVSFSADGTTSDELTIVNNVLITTSGSDLYVDGKKVGTFSGGTSGTDLVINWTSAKARRDSVQSVIQQIGYRNTSNDPGSSKTIEFVLNDGDGDSSTPVQQTVNIAEINQAPTLTTTATNPGFTEGGAAAVLFSGTSVDPAEAGDLVDTITLTVWNLQNGSDEILVVDGTSVALTDSNSVTTGANSYEVNVSLAGDTATVTIGKTGGFMAAAAETLVDGLAYENTSDAPIYALRIATMTQIRDDGGTANGGDDDNVLDIASTVTITAVNDAPTLDSAASPVLNSIDENSGAPVGAVGTLISDLVDFSGGGGLDNVTDPDTGLLTGIAVTGADTTNGTWFYSIDSGSNWNALGAVSDNSARLLAATAATRIYFQPTAEYYGTINSALTFRAWDRTAGSNGDVGVDTTTNGGTTAFSTATDTASITVNRVNVPPTTSNNTVTTDEDTTYTFTAADFNYNDADSDPMDHVQITSLESVGSLELSGVPVTLNQTITKAQIDAGNLKFVPVADQNGASYDSFEFRVHDGTEYSSQGTVFLVNATFDADSDGFTYADDTFGTSNPTKALGTYEAAGGYSGGGLRVYLGPGSTGIGMSGGWSDTFNLASDGTVTVSLRYRMFMGEGYESNEYGEVILDIDGTQYGNDTNTSLVHLDGNGNGGGTDDTGWLYDEFEIPLTAGNHTLTIGAYNNKATASDEWVEVFFDEVKVENISFTTMTVDVTPIDDPALISGDISYNGNEGDAVGGDMDATDVDGLTDTTYFTVTGAATNGTAVIDAETGVWTFTPTDGNWFGSDTFTVTITDDLGGTSTQVVNITLANVDDPAVISGDISYNGNEGDAVGGDMDATDVDGLTDTTYFTVTTPATNGTAAIDATTGVWTFTPADGNWFGSDTFTVTITDDLGGTTTQVVSITLANVDDPAVISGDISYNGNEGDAVGGDMDATDVDGLTDTTYFTVTTPATNGTAAIDATTGVWTFTPTDGNWFGSDTFTVTITDDLGGTSTQVVNITLANVDDPAVISGDISYNGNEGDAVGGDMDATDVDGLTDTTYFTVTTPATNGTAAIDAETGSMLKPASGPLPQLTETGLDQTPLP
jgi:hypothetical protein